MFLMMKQNVLNLELNIQVTKRRKLKPGSIDEQLVANWMEDGLGFRLTAMLLNIHQKEQGLLEVGK